MASSIQTMEIVREEMRRFARDMLRAVIAREHPDWTEDEVNRMVARRLSHGAI